MVLNAGEDIFVVVESELDGFLIAQEAGDMVVVVALGVEKTLQLRCFSFLRTIL